ncbi:MAG TPA: SurA N-terminal domain-containing protein, partial [Caulobacteraceae bacterium]
MMGKFRTFAKSPVAAVLMGLLIVSFGVWGVRDVFKFRISDAVVKAGSREVGSADFKQRFQQQLQQFRQQTGQAVTADEAAKQGVVQQFLDDLATSESVQEAVRRSGVQASDQLVINELRKIPAFFNPVTGAFEEQTYEQLLSQHNLTPAGFQQDLRDQLSMEHFKSAMEAGLQAPLSYAVLLSSLDQQGRVADYFLLDPRGQPIPAKPTDAQLKQMMTQYAAQLRRPELRQISMVRVSAQAIAPTLHPSDKDVQQMFNVVKARLSTPERRTFVQIPAKDAAQAAAIAARLGKDEDASAIAKSYGVKPLSFADTPQAQVPDPTVAQAVFAMQPGQTSGAIHGQFGLAVAKLVSITPAKPETLEEARPQIEKELNDKAAKNAAYDQSGAYSDAHSKGQPMVAAAKAAGVQVFVLPPITAEGKMPNGQPLPSLNPKMLKDAFSLPQGGETDITDLGGGEYYALRVDKVAPAAMPTLDQIREPL